MNYWGEDGSFGIHVFHKNNELAGYCSTLHAMELVGITGEYGRRLRATVISFGSTGRGAVTALAAHGHSGHLVADAAPGRGRRGADPLGEDITSKRDPDHPGQTLELDSEHESVAEFLAEHDIIVNCALQDTDAPLIFVMNDELKLFRRGTLFVDVACDEGMGFEWARPTSFASPIFTIGDGLSCYGVDHSPSLLVGLGHVGDQPGPDAPPADSHLGTPRVGGRQDHRAGDRDPRRRDPEPKIFVPGALGRIPRTTGSEATGGTQRAETPLSEGVHAIRCRGPREMKSGRPDSNRGLSAPKPNAMTRLRYAPRVSESRAPRPHLDSLDVWWLP